MMKLLWIGDAVAQTGFARVTHNVLNHLKTSWDVHVLGINYDGDPHPYSYPIYPAMRGGDVWGISRVKYLCRKVQPDVILILNDPWNIPPYMEEIDVPIPVVAYMPIDAPNQLAAPALKDLARAITYTKFGRRELLLGGYSGRCDVISHGVDTEMYYPVDRQEARERLKFGKDIGKDAYIVGNVNRNQPRKRLDLTIQFWSQWWINHGQPKNWYLYLHCSNRDIGWNVVQLARYFGIERQLIISNPRMTPKNALHESDMKYVYSAFDVQINTGMGEGWGLTTHEAMACGVPQIVGEYAALAEWAEGAVRFVPITSYAATPNNVNTIGGVMDMQGTLDALDELYQQPELRIKLGEVGRLRATEPRFAWSEAAQQFSNVLEEVVLDRRVKPTGIKEAQHGQVQEGQRTVSAG